jgi:hypothetical protein
MDAFEQRFHFAPISEMPPPDMFTNSKKVYEANNTRRAAAVAPY